MKSLRNNGILLICFIGILFFGLFLTSYAIDKDEFITFFVGAGSFVATIGIYCYRVGFVKKPMLFVKRFLSIL